MIRSLLFWLARVLFYRLFKLQVYGQPFLSTTKAPYILLANHCSLIDGILLGAFAPKDMVFVVNAEIAKKWWAKIFLTFINNVVIDPVSPQAVRLLLQQLEQNKPLLIFPEGRITVTGSLMRFQEGIGFLLYHKQVPVVMAYIDGLVYSKFSYVRHLFTQQWFPKTKLFLSPPKIVTPAAGAKTSKAIRQNLTYQLYNELTNFSFACETNEGNVYLHLLSAKHRFKGTKRLFEDITLQKTSYPKFVQRSLVLGKYLRQTQGDQTSLGILLPNTIALNLVFFAMQASGHTAVMINYGNSPSKLAECIKTADIKTIYSSRAFIQKAGLQNHLSAISELAEVIFLEDIRKNLTLAYKWFAIKARLWPSALYKKEFSPFHQSERPAVILFTSGTESKAKGVALSHQNIIANCQQIYHHVDFSPKDIIFNALPQFHVFGLMVGTLLPAFYAIPTFLYANPLHYRLVPIFCYEKNATVLFGTNSFLLGYGRKADPFELSRLRYVFAGAEKLQASTQNLYATKFGIRILEGYGATETSPVISLNTPLYHKPNSVGRLLPGIEYKIEKIAGIEQGGKLWLKGPNVMMGYLEADQPGRIKPQKQWYDTGDLVVIDGLRFVQILGRQKRFAKIGGEMVSLAAVEELIYQISPNASHAVITQSNKIKGETLVLITADANLKMVNIKKSFQASQQPNFLLPRKVIFSAEMPLLPNGKIDYPSLKQQLDQA